MSTASNDDVDRVCKQPSVTTSDKAAALFASDENVFIVEHHDRPLCDIGFAEIAITSTDDGTLELEVPAPSVHFNFNLPPLHAHRYTCILHNLLHRLPLELSLWNPSLSGDGSLSWTRRAPSDPSELKCGFIEDPYKDAVVQGDDVFFLLNAMCWTIMDVKTFPTLLDLFLQGKDEDYVSHDPPTLWKP